MLTDQDKAALQTLLADSELDIGVIKDSIAAVKAAKAGDKSALLALIPKVATLARQEFTDVKAALPIIKDGWRTSEFWLVAVSGIAGIISHVTGHPIPFNIAAAWGTVVGLYVLVRGLVKSKAATPIIVSTTPAAQ